MKITLIAAAGCALVTIAVLAAQNRPPEFQGPVSPIAAALDTNHDGSLSAAEIRSSTAALTTVDRNGDGQLTSDELRPAFGRGGRRGRGDAGERGGDAGTAPDDLADTLMAFDRNSDGKLARAEVPERFQGLFERADADKDGALTKDELKQSATATATQENGGRRGGDGRESGGRGRGGPVDPLVRALDRDGDGVVSGPEISAAPEALKILDANGDGQLSSEEFQPVFGRGRGGRQ
jgi:Ca2+-binding EF-hand superfamily protein